MNLADVAAAMAQAGCTSEQIAVTLKSLDTRSTAAKRQARYRERKRNESVTNRNSDVTVTLSDASPFPPDKERSPTPPKEITPLSPSDPNGSVVLAAVRTTEIQRKQRVDLIQEVVGMWNDLAGQTKLAQVRDITDRRQAAIVARSEALTKTYDFPDPLAGWRDVINRVRLSPFLRGENKQGWRCDFDFVIAPSSFTKIMEGKYAPEIKPKQINFLSERRH